MREYSERKVPAAGMEREGASGRVLPAGLGVMVGATVPGFLVASHVVQIREDFRFSGSALGAALALFYAASAVSAPVAGRVIDRIGATWGLRLAAALIIASSLGIASITNSVASLTLLLVVSGIGKAMAQPGVSALLAGRVPEGRRGLAFGLQTSGSPGSALLAGLALPLIAVPFDWRWSFVLAAGLMGVCTVCVPTASLANPRVSHVQGQARAEGGIKAVHLLTMSSGLASAAGLGLFSFLVVFSVDAGFGSGEAGLLLSATSLVSALSRVAFGVVADKRQGTDVLFQTTILLMICAAGLLLLASAAPILIILGSLFGVGIGWGWQALVNLFLARDNPERPATAIGTQVSGFFVGAVVGPLFVGWLAQQGVYATAWIICAALAVLAALAAAAARRF